MGRKSKEQVEAEKLAAEQAQNSGNINPVDTVLKNSNDGVEKTESVTHKQPKEEKEEMVSVKKSDLDKLISRVEKLTQDTTLLYKVADKSRLSKAMNENGEVLVRTVKVSTWADTGKFVIGWSLKSNRCEVILGRWIEEQTVSVMLDDKEVFDVPLVEFYRKIVKKVSGDLVSKTENTDAQGNEFTFFTLRFQDGRELLIDSTFVN